MRKRLLGMALAAAMIFGVVGCGGQGTSDIDMDDIGEVIEDMDGNEIEQAITDVNVNSESEATENTTSTTAQVVAPEPEEIIYAPTQKIMEAEFSSLKIQLNNDVFRQGGYMTVGDIVEQYGDRYEIAYMLGSYDECKDYLFEYKGSASYNDWFESYYIVMTPLYGETRHTIKAYIANLTSPDEKVTLDEMLVLYFLDSEDGSYKTRKTYVPMWIPNGFYANVNNYLSVDCESLSYSDFAAYFENLGFSKHGNGGISLYDADKKYMIVNAMKCSIYVMGEANLAGVKPVFRYDFMYNSNTEKLEYTKYEFVDVIE